MIQKIKIFRFGEKTVKGLPHFTDERALELPNAVKVNQSWKVRHECLNCSKSVEYGMNFDTAKNQFPSYDFSTTKYLCSKYYNEDTLSEINRVLPFSKLVILDGQSYLINKNEIDSSFPVSSSMKLALYNCNNCGEKYISDIEIQSPWPKSKEFPEGLLGEIKISGITQFEWNKLGSK